MDIVELGSGLLKEQLGLKVDTDTVASGLNSLLGDGGSVDLAGLASKMASNGNLGGILESWLGDGANAAISAQDILGLLGDGAVGDFANSVGTDAGSAAGGLAQVLPQLMDSASSGGSLLDAVGGAEGLLGAAKSFLS